MQSAHSWSEILRCCVLDPALIYDAAHPFSDFELCNLHNLKKPYPRSPRTPAHLGTSVRFPSKLINQFLSYRIAGGEQELKVLLFSAQGGRSSPGTG